MASEFKRWPKDLWRSHVFIFWKEKLYVYRKMLNISRNCLGQVLVSKVSIPRFRFHAKGHNFYGPYVSTFCHRFVKKCLSWKSKSFLFFEGRRVMFFPSRITAKVSWERTHFWVNEIPRFVCCGNTKRLSGQRKTKSVGPVLCKHLSPRDCVTYAHGRCAACRYKRSHCASLHQVSLSTNAGRLKVSLKGLSMLMWQSENSTQTKRAPFIWSVWCEASYYAAHWAQRILKYIS